MNKTETVGKTVDKTETAIYKVFAWKDSVTGDGETISCCWKTEYLLKIKTIRCFPGCCAQHLNITFPNEEQGCGFCPCNRSLPVYCMNAPNTPVFGDTAIRIMSNSHTNGKLMK